MLPNLSRLVYTPFFQNKIVLYGSLILVLLSILRHLSNRNINAIILMALIGLITSYFSKNMIIILITAFASVFVLELMGSPGVTEGMSTKEGAENEGDANNEDTSEDDTTEELTNNKEGAKNKGKEKKKKKIVLKKNTEDDEEGNTGMDTADKKNKNKQGMSPLSPANYDGKKDDDEKVGVKNGNRIDYASTLEQAYDNIDNIIGEDGVRGLTDQTKSLMHQQQQLMNNMKEMGPLLKSAEGFMEQITGGGGIKGITNMLQGFATPGGAKKNTKK
jgi:hypothetical protein